MAATLEALPPLTIPERLREPHPVIAEWLAVHARRREDARRNRADWGGKALVPPPLNAIDHRMHRVLDGVFKALDRNGASVTENDRGELLVICGDERVQLTVREKLKRLRRPLTEDEKRWDYLRQRGYVQELQASGLLVLEIKTWLPSGFRQKWEETELNSLQEMAPALVATLVAVFPFLAARTRERSDREQREAIERQRRQQDRIAQQTERNRWRRLIEIATAWRDAQTAQALIGALRVNATELDVVVDDRSLADWLTWAETQAVGADPISGGAEALFRVIAAVSSETYPDNHKPWMQR